MCVYIYIYIFKNAKKLKAKQICKNSLSNEGVIGQVFKWHALSSRHSWAELFESVMDDTSLARPEPGDDGFDRRWMAFRQLLDMLFAEAGVPAVFRKSSRLAVL